MHKDMDRLSDGIAPQAIYQGQYLLFHGQTLRERTATLRLLRHEKHRGQQAVWRRTCQKETPMRPANDQDGIPIVDLRDVSAEEQRRLLAAFSTQANLREPFVPTTLEAILALAVLGGTTGVFVLLAIG